MFLTTSIHVEYDELKLLHQCYNMYCKNAKDVEQKCTVYNVNYKWHDEAVCHLRSQLSYQMSQKLDEV